MNIANSNYNISPELRGIFGSEDELQSFITQLDAAYGEANHDRDNYTVQSALNNFGICLAKDQKLGNCSKASLKDIFTKLVSFGLYANTALKEAYILSYGKDAQLMFGVSGHAKIMKKIFPRCRIFYKILTNNDDIDYRYEDGQSKISIKINCEKPLSTNKRENIKGVLISLKSDDYLREEIVFIDYINEVEQARNKRGGSSSFWNNHFGAMACKTALIKFSKDLITANPGKTPELFFQALDAEAEASGFPSLRKEELKNKPETKLESTQDIIKELEEMSNDEENPFG